MPRPFELPNPPLAFGLTSLALATIALLLFFLPILGMPLASFGLLFALAGVVAWLRQKNSSLPWSLGGLALSLLALSIGVAIGRAPQGYIETRSRPVLWQEAPGERYVPPPARPNWDSPRGEPYRSE